MPSQNLSGLTLAWPGVMFSTWFSLMFVTYMTSRQHSDIKCNCWS